MEIIEGVAANLPVELLCELALCRVFVEMLEWNVAVKDGLELDQFDRSDTHYDIALGEEGKRLARRGFCQPISRTC